MVQLRISHSFNAANRLSIRGKKTAFRPRSWIVEALIEPLQDDIEFWPSFHKQWCGWVDKDLDGSLILCRDDPLYSALLQTSLLPDQFWITPHSPTLEHMAVVLRNVTRNMLFAYDAELVTLALSSKPGVSIEVDDAFTAL